MRLGVDISISQIIRKHYPDDSILNYMQCKWTQNTTLKHTNNRDIKDQSHFWNCRKYDKLMMNRIMTYKVIKHTMEDS